MYSADSQKIMRPWTPIEAKEENNTCKFDVWGRTYEASSNCMLSSIISQGKELLASPIRVVAIDNGEKITFDNAKCFLMDDVTPESAAFCASSEAGDLIVNTTCKVEYDGFMKWTLAVMPQGLSVAACCGVKEPEHYECNLTSFWLEIPLRSELFPYFAFSPNNDYKADGKIIEKGDLNRAGFIPNHLEVPFCYQTYLSCDETGLAFIAESDEGWQHGDYPFEIIKNGEETLLRIHFLDEAPDYWKTEPDVERLTLLPITFQFGMIATPVKQLAANPYQEKGLHIDCAHKLMTDYEEYLFDRFVDTGEITGLPDPKNAVYYDEMTFDRIERMGVKTLYLHEKWNTTQNSPYITRQSANRLRHIVKEAHSRGIKVIPYFGYEISTLAPYWGEFGLKYSPYQKGENAHWTWYRFPAQRDMQVCYEDPEFRRFFTEGIRKLITEFDFDGLYLDGTVYPRPCTNEEHGCGYRDKDGNLHETYPMFAIRELMKELYSIVDPRGGVINCHSGLVYNFAAVSFYHSMWDGEIIQMPFLRGQVHELPEGFMRAIFNFRSIGNQYYMLCYANAPKWDFRRGLSLSLLFGILPKINNAGTPLDAMEVIWKIFDRIPMEIAKWHPFYEENGEIVSSDPFVRSSYFEYQDVLGRTCRLIFTANTHDTPSDATLNFKNQPTTVKVLYGTEMQKAGGGLKVHYDNFDLTVLFTESET